jgi:glycosyl transferase family 25
VPSIRALLDDTEWDFVYFGHEETGDIPRADWKTSPQQFRLCVSTGDIQCAHFYALSSRILPRLIEHLEAVARGREGDQQCGPMPIDGALNIFRRKTPDVRTLIANPKLGWQRPSRSDITGRSFDRVHFLRPLTTAARELKHRIALWYS